MSVYTNPHVAKIRFTGFTLLETMIAVSIACVLTMVAVPSFASMVNHNRIKAATSDLHLALIHARNHAITNASVVIVCQQHDTDKLACNEDRSRHANWANGWLSYADLNNNNELDPSDAVLRVFEGDEDLGIVFNQTGRLRFFSDGSARSAGFYICHNKSNKARYLRLLHTGRARLSGQLNTKKRAICLSKAKS